MLRTVTLFLCLLASWSLRSQEITTALPEGTYLTVGLGIPVHTVRDKINSPLAYRGSGINFRVGVERVRANWLSQFRIAFSNAALRPRVKPRRDVNKSAQLSEMRIALGLYRRVSAQTAESAQYVGLSIAGNLDQRNYPLPANNTVGHHYRVGFRVGALDRRGLTNGNRYALSSQIDVPILTKLYRPTYIGMTPFLHRPSTKGKDYWKSMRWVGPGGYLGVEARFAADYIAQPFRSDRLEYAFWLGYTPQPHPKSLLFTAGQLSYAYRARL